MRRPISSVLRIAIATGVAVCGGLASNVEAVERGDAVVLRLSDGRVARGVLDSEPSSDHVVLATSTDGIEVRSRFAADRVLSILAADEFDRDNGTILLDGAAPGPRRPTASAARRPRVRSLSIAARVANWDADPEIDGLLVHVVPLDDDGEVVPVDGTLNFELTLQQFATRRQLPWRRRDRPFFTSDRWSVPLRASDFGLHGAYVRLPFKQAHPEIDLDVAPNGLLRGRLGVRGQGVFEASDADVRLRRFSRFRDELEQLTGQRFHQRERVGRWPSSSSSRLRTFP